MAQGRSCYCAPFRGPHVEKQQHVVHSSTEITVKVLWYIHSARVGDTCPTTCKVGLLYRHASLGLRRTVVPSQLFVWCKFENRKVWFLRPKMSHQDNLTTRGCRGCQQQQQCAVQHPSRCFASVATVHLFRRRFIYQEKDDKQRKGNTAPADAEPLHCLPALSLCSYTE